jgi:UDP-N-acetylbacillosamine N-acetyltransferase
MTPDRYPQTGFLAIYGAGGHGLVVAEAATDAGWRVLGFIDDAKPLGTRVGAWSVIDPAESAKRSVELIVAVGDNATRRRLTRLKADEGQRLAVVIHPAAMVSPSVNIDRGTFIGPMAVVQAEATVGEGVIINSGAIVEHHCRVGSYAHIAPRVALAGHVEVGELTLVGIGACALPGVKIGARCVVGAGAVVVADIAEGKSVVGVPAR